MLQSIARTLRSWYALLALGAIVSIGVLVRLNHLDERTMGHKEIFAPNIALPWDLSIPHPRLTLWQTLKGSMGEPHPPAWYLTMWPWTKLLGSDIVILRLPSVLWGVTAIFLIYLLGSLEEDRLTALIAAGLLAFNGFHIFWSQIASPYSMACTLGLLSTVTLLLAFREKEQWQYVFLLLYLITTLYGLVTLYYFWPVFATQILWMILNILTTQNMRLDFFREQLFILILSSPILALAIFQQRPSYLSSNFFEFLRQYASFGFLFIDDLDAMYKSKVVSILRHYSIFIALPLFLLGFFGRRKKILEQEFNNESRYSLFRLILATFFAFLCFVFASRVVDIIAPNSQKSKEILISSVIPLLIFLLGFLFQVYAFKWNKLANTLIANKIIPGGPYSLISCLAILPVIIIVGISLFIPFFADRGMLLFIPYLFIVLSRGISSLVRNNLHRLSFSLFLITILFLAVIHYYGIVYCYSRPESPADYKGLAQKWIKNIDSSDLVFVKRHWVTTPIFYYIKGDRYNFIGENYSKELYNNPNARVWTLSFIGENLPEELKNGQKEMQDSLSNYKSLLRIDARRIKAELYIPTEQDFIRN
jgi:4-amino-4-deoxy-L-arabinose transferase-like glycosyltransferase